MPTYFSSLGSPTFSKLFIRKISPWRRLHKDTEIWHYCNDLNTICTFLHLPHCIQLLLVPVGSLLSQMRAFFTIYRLRTYWFSAFPLHTALNRSPWFGPPISSGPGEVFVIDLTEHMFVAFVFLVSLVEFLILGVFSHSGSLFFFFFPNSLLLHAQNIAKKL